MGLDGTERRSSTIAVPVICVLFALAPGTFAGVLLGLFQPLLTVAVIDCMCVAIIIAAAIEGKTRR
jgi:hypothetical protein